MLFKRRIGYREKYSIKTVRSEPAFAELEYQISQVFKSRVGVIFYRTTTHDSILSDKVIHSTPRDAIAASSYILNENIALQNYHCLAHAKRCEGAILHLIVMRDRIHLYDVVS